MQMQSTITEQASVTESQQTLLDSEEQYRGIFEGSTTGISLRDPHGKIVAANPALCRMYGYTLAEYLTKTPADLAHPDSLPLFFQLREAALAGKQFHAEAKGIHKDGHIIDVEVYGTMVLYKGSPHVLASLLDISERKRAEDLLRQTTEVLRQERESLKQKNNALRQILDHLDEERREYKHEICDSIEKLLMPVVETLKHTGGKLGPREVAVLEDTLSSIIRRDIDLYQSNIAKLSPRELDIVDLIKQGMESKEIASKLSLSDQTIHKHRKLIRQKLQLRNKDVNLAAYLRSR